MEYENRVSGLASELVLFVHRHTVNDVRGGRESSSK